MKNMCNQGKPMIDEVQKIYGKYNKNVNEEKNKVVFKQKMINDERVKHFTFPKMTMQSEQRLIIHQTIIKNTSNDLIQNRHTKG